MSHQAQTWSQERKTIALVPTMGALHEGHLSLVRAARARCDKVVVSLFVNPLQFGPSEDLEAYPRTFKSDLKKCAKEKVDLVFTPSVEKLYPEGFETTVKAGKLARPWCGRSRPGHFDGVLTVVSLLFHLVRPQKAIFGEKDFQQLVLIRRMIEDLHFPVEVIGMPVVREQDGLAMSSRNSLLGKMDRRRALRLSRALKDVQKEAQKGERSARALTQRAKDILTRGKGLEVDYVGLVDPQTLLSIRHLDAAARLLIAAKVGDKNPVRLIDNGEVCPGG